MVRNSLIFLLVDVRWQVSTIKSTHICHEIGDSNAKGSACLKVLGIFRAKTECITSLGPPEFLSPCPPFCLSSLGGFLPGSKKPVAVRIPERGMPLTLRCTLNEEAAMLHAVFQLGS